MNPEDVDDMDFPLPGVVAVDDFSNVGPKKMIYSEDEQKFKDWTVIYPIYFDKARKFGSGGRRVNKELAIDKPNVLHLLYVTHNLGLKTTFEVLKRHPKDFDNYGRIRVNLLLDNGFYCFDDITSKKQLLLKIAELLPNAKDTVDEVDTFDPKMLVEKANQLIANIGRF
ncbi:signal recognition particle, SRP19 subunit [Neoconidiobolus thromboides FSU 785]|nr:signal recognition particle, SRP19 subunit [Neoconidiobolus thromboides FSU 785]